MTAKRPTYEETSLAEGADGLTVQEAGRRGGRATLENQGAEFFRRIGEKGGERTRDLYRELLVEFGKRGGRPPRPGLEKATGEESSAKKGGKMRSALGGSSPDQTYHRIRRDRVGRDESPPKNPAQQDPSQQDVLVDGTGEGNIREQG